MIDKKVNEWVDDLYDSDSAKYNLAIFQEAKDARVYRLRKKVIYFEHVEAYNHNLNSTFSTKVLASNARI